MGVAGVREVDLVQVDVVRPEAPEAPLYLVEDVLPGCARHVRPVTAGCRDLGCDYGLAAAALESPADVLLGQRVAVAVGGVDRVHALVEGGADDALRTFVVEPAAKVVGAQTDDGHVEPRAAELPVLQ